MIDSSGDPLVTVFTSAHNHDRYLDAYFAGLLGQTYENVELIIYDDGSTDQTWAKIREHEPALRAKFPRVILERHENIGPEEETALGVARAEGELLCLLESDDHYLPTKLEKNVRYLQQHPEAGAVHSDVDFLYGNRLERAHWQTTGRSIPSGHVLEDLLFDNFVATCSLCCRTSLFKQHVDLRKYMARRYSAPDYALCLELASHAQIGYIDEPLARYRATSGSYSHPPEPERLFAFQRSIYAMKLDFVREHDVPAGAAKMVERQYYTYLYRGGFRACLTTESERGYAWLRDRYPSEHRGLTHALRQSIVRRPRLCAALQAIRRLCLALAARATRRSPGVVEAGRANLPPLLASASPGRRRRALFSRSRIGAGARPSR